MPSPKLTYLLRLSTFVIFDALSLAREQKKDLQGRMHMPNALSIGSAIATFGAKAKSKLANPGVTGEPEDQLRAPFEQLLADLAELSNVPRTKVVAVGESSLSDLKTRPDYAVTVHNALAGHIELKAPGKGA